MKKFQIAGLLVAMVVFAGCDDDGGSKTPDGGDASAIDAAGSDGAATDAGGGAGGGMGGVDAGGGATVDGALPPFATGFDGTKVLSQLSRAEQRQLCAADAAWIRQPPVYNALCGYMAVFTAWYVVDQGKPEEAPTACQEVTSECLAEGVEEEGCEEALPACHITVAEVEKCRKELMESLKTFVDKQPACNVIKASDVANLEPALRAAGSIPSCDAAEPKCPGISGRLNERF